MLLAVGCGGDAPADDPLDSGFADASRADARIFPDANMDPAGATVVIPSGNFIMGCKVADETCEPDELPPHSVSLSGYEIERTEVVQFRYQLCIEAGACQAPSIGYSPSTKPSHPVVAVTRGQAQDYCEWLGRRLPTEAEWEYAARGNEQRVYPWGNQAPTCLVAHFQGCAGDDAPKPAGTLLLGASVFGTLDMSGNVAEWVADTYSATYYQDSLDSPQPDPIGPSASGPGIFRGGSFRYGPNSTLGGVETSARFVDDVAVAYDDLGFRCVVP